MGSTDSTTLPRPGRGDCIALFAPTIDRVELVGDFNRGAEQPIVLERGDDGWHRFSLAGVPDGVYRYRFRLRSRSWFREEAPEVELFDPEAAEIEREQGESEATAASIWSVVRIRGGERILEDHQWEHDDVPLANNAEIIIYELHVGAFSGGEADGVGRGRFTDVIKKLDYLEDLGINAIELLPVTAFPDRRSWGYTPISFFAPDPSYGTPAELKRLIDAAHGRGMRVILDLVLNHTSTKHPLTEVDHDFWFYHDVQDPENSWGPQFNFEHHDESTDLNPALLHTSRAVRFWVEEYHIDGIRYDAARQIRHYHVLQRFSEVARQAAPDKPFLNAAEYLPPRADLIRQGAMDATWYDTFYHAVHAQLLVEGQIDLDTLMTAIDSSRADFHHNSEIVNYTSNHDKSRLFESLGEKKHIVEGPAFGRAHLAATILMTSVGMPMLFMGDEYGVPTPFDPECCPIDWTLLQHERNRNLFNHYRRLIELRRTNDALKQSNISFLQADADAAILSWSRWTEGGARVVVVANLRDEPKSDWRVENMPADGRYLDWIAGGEPLEARDHAVTIPSLGGLEAKVLVWTDPQSS